MFDDKKILIYGPGYIENEIDINLNEYDYILVFNEFIDILNIEDSFLQKSNIKILVFYNSATMKDKYYI